MDAVQSGSARSVIIGGQGAVGRLFAWLLRSEGAVTLVDLRQGTPMPGVSSMVADVRSPDPRLTAELARADVVVLAVPADIGAAATAAVAPHLRRGALLAETLSVKAPIADAMERAADRHGLEALGVNPMFAPDLGFQGRPVVIVEVRGGERSRRLQTLIRAGGGRLVPVSAADHDRLTAALQVATHAGILAFGRALQILDADIATLVAAGPPPHRTLLALLARIVTGTPEVYRDIQVAHPHAHAARLALRDACTQVDDAATAAPEDRIEAMLAELADWLGPYRERLADDCVDLFSRLAAGAE
ncbi:MAG TPA: prephenate dehydrogenase/arogenate dehydrogenase family protein [Streptosporangiaceae bacterium]|nr:prephenate dehydrogenase/arogenate dehydrogenase family protein [Streptosporangiaceae bacterium]